ALILLFCSNAFFSPFNIETYSLALAIWNVIRKPRARMANKKNPVVVMIFNKFFTIGTNSFQGKLFCFSRIPLRVVNNGFFHKRVVLCYQRTAAQRPAYCKHDQTNKTSRYTKVKYA